MLRVPSRNVSDSDFQLTRAPILHLYLDTASDFDHCYGCYLGERDFSIAERASRSLTDFLTFVVFCSILLRDHSLRIRFLFITNIQSNGQMFTHNKHGSIQLTVILFSTSKLRL